MLRKTTMQKRTYYLPRILIEKLADYSNKAGLSTADIIRMGAKEYMRRHELK